MPRQGKESVTTTSSLNGPVFRPEFRKHPWRCSSSWEDRMPRQSSSFRTFTSCSKLLSPSPNMLLFSCYWALDAGHTRLFPCPPATATFSFLSKSQELVPSSEQFYHAGSPQQRGAVVTFSFTTWLDERDSIPYPSSLGQEDKKKKRPSEVKQDTNRTSLFHWLEILLIMLILMKCPNCQVIWKYK